jgi:AcrR family transcriptional regulator
MIDTHCETATLTEAMSSQSGRRTMKQTVEAAAQSAERREKKKAMRQEQLIDAAEKVFVERGYDAATIDMITEEIGYNKRTFYLYFKDRDDVFFAVLLRSLGVLYALMRGAAEREPDGVSRLIAMGRAYYEYFRENPVYFEFNRIFETRVYYYHKKPGEDSGEFAARCQRANDRITDLLIEAIKGGIKDRSIALKLGPKKLMLILWGMTFGLVEVILMRRPHLESSYQTSADEVFGEYMSQVRRFLEGK